MIVKRICTVLAERARRGRPPRPHLVLDCPRFKFHLARLDTDQHEVARAVGVGAAHLSAVVTGRRPLTADLAARIAEALGVGVDEITEKQESTL